MRVARFALVLALVPVATAAQVCRPAIAPAHQHRPAMRRRAPGLEPPVPTDVTEIAGWPAPVDAQNPAVRDRDDPIDERETQGYVLTGSLWRVTIESDDCDLHLELSAPGAGANSPRVVAEIPATVAFLPARDAILRSLPASVRLVPGQSIDLAVPVTVTVTGFAFYDTARAGRSDPRHATHESALVSTLWGLHPVWSAVPVRGR